MRNHLLAGCICLLLVFFSLAGCTPKKKQTLPAPELLSVSSLTTTIEPAKTQTEAAPSTTIPPKEPKTKKKKLREELELRLAEKDYPEEAKTFIRECFDQLYRNYPTWKTAYRDLPSREMYIRENLIDVIPRIPEIEMIRTGTARAKELEQVAPAFTEQDFRVRVIYGDPATVSEEEHLEDLELLLHEIAHCETPHVFNPAPYEQKESTQYWFTEGEATFHSKFMFPLSPLQSAAWMISNTSGTRTLSYGKTTGAGYMFAQYAYENLVFFAGYDVVKQVGHHDGVSLVRHAIAEKYGKAQEQAVWETICTLSDSLEKAWNTDASYRLAVKLQKMLLDFWKQDIRALHPGEPAQIRQFMDLYRYYKLKIMPAVEDDHYNLLTSETFDLDSVDDLLIDKIVEADLFHFSKNPNRNRMAIKSILYADNQLHGEPFGDYLPATISKTQYTYGEYRAGNEIRGRLQAKYRESWKSGDAIVMVFEFNESQLLRISNRR